MSKQKQQWLQFYNRMLAGIMTLLGFTACGMPDIVEPAEYGTPHATYEIKGKVLTPEKEASPGIQIILKREINRNSGKFASMYGDTIKTDQKGEFYYKQEEVSFGDMEYRIVYRDVEHEIYKTDSVQVKMEAKGGSGRWNNGSDSKEVTINLEKKDAE